MQGIRKFLKPTLVTWTAFSLVIISLFVFQFVSVPYNAIRDFYLPFGYLIKAFFIFNFSILSLQMSFMGMFMFPILNFSTSSSPLEFIFSLYFLLAWVASWVFTLVIIYIVSIFISWIWSRICSIRKV